MKNHENAELLLAYCARKLDPDSAAVLERHMAICPECAGLRDGQQAVWTALDSWKAQPVSADFDRRLNARIDAADAAAWYERAWDRVGDVFRPLIWRPAYPVAAVCALAIGGFVLEQRPGVDPKPVQPSEIRVSTSEAEQVERTLEDMEMLRQFDPVTTENRKAPKSM
ncbi:MAG: zf-HC2 domain-containing protein [Acidobacteriota bacterium]|nr:zf-HC2 domain-containing protein [Acidobacteriota bacterium]